MVKCIYCNSTNVQQEVLIDQNTAEPGGIGLKYRVKFFTCVEPIYVDLCKNCGSIIRFYVKNADRNWSSK